MKNRRLLPEKINALNETLQLIWRLKRMTRAFVGLSCTGHDGAVLDGQEKFYPRDLRVAAVSS
jgi:hypothetical protein